MHFHYMRIICLYYVNKVFYLYDVFLVIIYYSYVSTEKAVYHVKRVVLVNTEIVDEYLENFRDEL